MAGWLVPITISPANSRSKWRKSFPPSKHTEPLNMNLKKTYFFFFFFLTYIFNLLDRLRWGLHLFEFGDVKSMLDCSGVRGRGWYRDRIRFLIPFLFSFCDFSSFLLFFPKTEKFILIFSFIFLWRILGHCAVQARMRRTSHQGREMEGN